MKLATFIAAVTLAMSAVTTQAHEAKGFNGGKVAGIANGHMEFTHSPTEVTLYTTDEEDKPIKTAADSGKVIIQSGGKTAQVQLTPAEPNKLVGKLEAPLTKGAVAVVSATVGGKAVQARFTVN